MLHWSRTASAKPLYVRLQVADAPEKLPCSACLRPSEACCEHLALQLLVIQSAEPGAKLNAWNLRYASAIRAD